MDMGYIGDILLLNLWIDLNTLCRYSKLGENQIKITIPRGKI